jgi:aspartate racemase
MNRIGIIGGIGPESTIEYYRLIIQRYQERLRTRDFPPVLINSINMMAMGELISQGQLAELTRFLLREIDRLGRAGASHVVLASNTPHLVFDELEKQSPVPLISIIRETCRHLHEGGYTRVGLLGTKQTMAGDMYPREARRYGIQVHTPTPARQEYIHEKYLNELLYKDIRPDTQREFITIVRQLHSDSAIQALVLGGTELPFILNPENFPEISVINSAAVHVESIVSAILAGAGTPDEENGNTD